MKNTEKAFFLFLLLAAALPTLSAQEEPPYGVFSRTERIRQERLVQNPRNWAALADSFDRLGDPVKLQHDQAWQSRYRRAVEDHFTRNGVESERRNTAVFLQYAGRDNPQALFLAAASLEKRGKLRKRFASYIQQEDLRPVERMFAYFTYRLRADLHDFSAPLPPKLAGQIEDVRGLEELYRPLWEAYRRY